MADYIDISAPVFGTVTVTPNPAAASGTFIVSAQITEEVIRRMYPMPFAAGEIDSGER